MTFHSLRSRLTFWYAATLLGVLLAFAGWMWFAVHRYLAANADDRINRRLQGLNSAIEAEVDESINALREELREFSIEMPEGELTAVRGRGGRDLLRPAGMSEALLWSAPQGQIGDLYAGRERHRAFRTRIKIKDETYDIAVATSTTEADRFLGQFRLLLIGAAPMLALIASLGGYWMSRRALAPVDDLTTAARIISLDNLGQRLEVSKTGDELERLGETWNEMLGRLDKAVQLMRQFTADASHELRTPISIIRTSAELALRRDRDPEEYRKALENIHHEAEWMTQLAEDLLLLARADSGTLALRREFVDVDQLARSVSDETAPMAEIRGVEMRTRLGAGEAGVQGDGRALHRLLSILLDNAVQHTPARGMVEIATSASDGGVAIAVRNTGEGISGEDLPHIFERFYRGDPARTRQSGAGLGLAIARSIAQAHGAEIDVDSSPGNGAVFSVKMPRV
jgi:two-component system, OmpR family, heavy metal sensor histidine kinase CusS